MDAQTIASQGRPASGDTSLVPPPPGVQPHGGHLAFPPLWRCRSLLVSGDGERCALRARVPEEAPAEVAALMAECLDQNPKARPSAREIFERLSAVAAAPPDAAPTRRADPPGGGAARAAAAQEREAPAAAAGAAHPAGESDLGRAATGCGGGLGAKGEAVAGIGGSGAASAPVTPHVPPGSPPEPMASPFSAAVRVARPLRRPMPIVSAFSAEGMALTGAAAAEPRGRPPAVP